MLKSILVPTAGYVGDPSALETALAFARLFNGHLDCVHVRRDPRQILMDATTADMGTGMGISVGSGMIVADVIAAFEESDQQHADHARKAFQAFFTREKLLSCTIPQQQEACSAEWRELRGREAEILVPEARLHDLTVIGHASANGRELSREVATKILMSSGRPILLAPKKAPHSLTGVVAIAWKDTAESARAVVAAMPILEKARKIIIINIAEDELATVESAEGLKRNLGWHGLQGEIQYMAHGGDSIHGTITQAAKESGAELIVMGGYGRMRLSEFIFGGVTREILADAPMPVLMMH